MGTIIISKCNCESKFQDEKYGKGNRAHKECLKEKIRCTVCGKDKSRK